MNAGLFSVRAFVTVSAATDGLRRVCALAVMTAEASAREKEVKRGEAWQQQQQQTATCYRTVAKEEEEKARSLASYTLPHPSLPPLLLCMTTDGRRRCSGGGPKQPATTATVRAYYACRACVRAWFCVGGNISVIGRDLRKRHRLNLFLPLSSRPTATASNPSEKAAGSSPPPSSSSSSSYPPRR